MSKTKETAKAEETLQDQLAKKTKEELIQLLIEASQAAEGYRQNLVRERKITDKLLDR